MHEQIEERKRANVEEEEETSHLDADVLANSPQTPSSKMFECPNCLRCLQRANRTRHMRRCTKANQTNENPNYCRRLAVPKANNC